MRAPRSRRGGAAGRCPPRTLPIGAAAAPPPEAEPQPEEATPPPQATPPQPALRPRRHVRGRGWRRGARPGSARVPPGGRRPVLGAPWSLRSPLPVHGESISALDAAPAGVRGPLVGPPATGGVRDRRCARRGGKRESRSIHLHDLRRIVRVAGADGFAAARCEASRGRKR